MDCDPLARWYRWLEYLGMGLALERRRLEFLPELTGKNHRGATLEAERDRSQGRQMEWMQGGADAPLVGNRSGRPTTGKFARALILGDGDGRFLTAFVKANAEVCIDYVDCSAKMFALAKQRIEARCLHGTRGRVTFYQADAREWTVPAGRSYDLVVTHFFLDCLTELEIGQLVSRLRLTLQTGARWIVSEFHQPETGFAAWRARVWIGGLYRLFGWATGLKVRHLPDYGPVLERHGFRCQQKVIAEMGLLVSEWWELGG